MGSSKSALRALLLLGLATGAAVAQAPRAGTGSITGRVTSTGAGTPGIPDAQVTIVSLQGGTRTSDNGGFRLANLPAGNFVLRVVRIGFEARSVPVTLRAGEAQVVNVELTPTVQQLDAVVTTATGETQRRREQGVNVATVKVDETVPLPAVQNFSQVMSSRVAGVNVAAAGGSSGTGSRIRIRGPNSVSLSNDPLLVIDGVRVNATSNSTTIGVGGQQPSRFDDINPEDIETIEVFKGPAGVALYGIQAANGVIQITTKRGRAGQTRWNVFSELGNLRDPTDYPLNYWQTGVNPANGSRVVQCNIDLEAQRGCIARRQGVGGAAFTDTLYTFNPLAVPSITPLRTGTRQQYGMSTAGGGDALKFFVAGDYDREFGVVGNNDIRRINARANFDIKPSEKVFVSVSTGYLNSSLDLPQNDNNANGAISGGILGRGRDCGGAAGDPLRAGCLAGDTASRGFFTANNPARNFFEIGVAQEIQRFIGSVNLRWQPVTWLQLTGVQGIDILSRFDNSLLRNGRVFTSADNAAGTRAANRFNINNYTSIGTATATYGLTSSLRAVSSASVQYNAEIVRGSNASGIGLIPGTASLATTSRNFAVGETNQPFITLGGVVRQQLQWRDRLFLEGGIRGDDNSAFGVDIGFRTTPYTQASWVISEESWFPKGRGLQSLRLRGGWGRSNTRPGFRDAATTLNAVAVAAGGEQAAVTVNTAGNANLRPATATEWETGFDWSGFDGALALELTYFDKRTRNDLIARPLAPSLGNAGVVFDNIGEMRNRGFEALMRANLVQRPNFAFSFDVNVATLRNTLTELGEGIQPFFLGASQRFVEGFPAAGFWERPVLSAEDRNGDGIISRVNCPTVGGVSNPQVAGGPACEVVLDTALRFMGNILPRTEISFLPRLTLFRYVNIVANLNHRAGYSQFNNTFFFRCQPNPNNCRELMDRNASLADQTRGVSALMGTRALFIEPADLWRLRELAVTLAAPPSIARRFFGGREARLTLAGTNLWLSTFYSGFDPEVNAGAQANFTTSDFLSQPPVRRVSARLDLSF